MVDVSIIIPCLNEERTLPLCIERARLALESLGMPSEIVVSDNGSMDASVMIAEANGARVVHCKERGYGAALQYGICEAAGSIIVFADGDNTYDFAETHLLVQELQKGFDLVMGDRINGHIVGRAMPMMHQHLGTPFLNFMINLLHARGGSHILDCNSGFRCFKKEAFLSWNVLSTGMEFASEMIIKALKHGARISHVPITLRPDMPGRKPHLKRWRDGMRHLLQILLEAPQFFYYSGLTLFVISWLVIVLSLVVGIVRFGVLEILGIHSMMFGLLGSCFGLGIWGIGLSLASRVPTTLRMYQYLAEMPEERVFWYSVGTAIICAVMLCLPVVYWATHGFHSISIEKPTLFAVTAGINGLFLVLHLLSCHLVRRSM